MKRAARFASTLLNPSLLNPSLLKNSPFHISVPCRITIILAAILILFAGSDAKGAASPELLRLPQDQKISIPDGKLDFRGYLGLALRYSPFLVSSRVEIDLKRIDETDARWSFIPTLSVATGYYINSPAGISPYVLRFAPDPYSPLESYATLQARKVATQMAIMGHQQVISEFIYRLAGSFLDLDGLTRAEVYQDQLIDLAEQNVTYTETRLKSGTGTPAENNLAVQEEELARTEAERLKASEIPILGALKANLKLPSDQKLDLDSANAREQVLNAFDPASATFAQAEANSLALKTQRLKQELQGRNVGLARLKYLPTFFFTVENASPVYQTANSINNRVYYSVGIQMPLWDDFNRVRNVAKQKLVLEQYEADSELKEQDLQSKWQDARSRLKTAEAQLKVAKAQLELAKARENQVETGYHEARQPFSALINERRGRLEALKLAGLRSLEYDKVVLEIRYLSGDLYNSYVQVQSQ